MMLLISKGIALECYKSPRGPEYLTIATQDGQIKMRSSIVKLSDVPLMVPLDFELNISSRLFNGTVSLTVEQINVTKVD